MTPFIKIKLSINGHYIYRLDEITETIVSVLDYQLAKYKAIENDKNSCFNSSGRYGLILKRN